MEENCTHEGLHGEKKAYVSAKKQEKCHKFSRKNKNISGLQKWKKFARNYSNFQVLF